MTTQLPKTMTAIAITRFGDPEVLEPVEIPLPRMKVDDLLIRVAAAGVNRPDIMQRRGLYPAPKGVTEIPGLEVSGEIVAMGSDTSGWRLGDTVSALVAGGGYAEYCTVPAAQCLPAPTALSKIEAAALPETFFTVWSNVFDRGGLQSGETFMVHGGTSGIGTTAIQLARAFGATVITTSGSDEKAAFCKTLGADLSLNYKTQDFVEEVTAFTEGKGVDVLLDMVAGDYVDRNLRIMATEGRIVVIAVQRGPKVTANILPIMLKRLTLTGSTLRTRDIAFKADVADNLRTHVWPRIEDGEIRPVIGKVFPLSEAAAAHHYLESGQNIGKVILTTGD